MNSSMLYLQCERTCQSYCCIENINFVLVFFSDIAGMLLKSTGDFLDAGLQKSGNEFWECADDSTASDEIRCVSKHLMSNYPL